MRRRPRHQYRPAGRHARPGDRRAVHPGRHQHRHRGCLARSAHAGGGGGTLRVTENDAYPAPIPDVEGTARKIAEAESSIPASVEVYTPSRADRTGANAGSRAVARTVGGLTAIDAGPDAGRLFIRGVADTPFSGYGQSPVSVEIDEARATFDAPAPALR